MPKLSRAFALVPLVFISAYALRLRVGQYGWTVERITTLPASSPALCYAFGYAAAAVFSLMGRPWMQLQLVNIGTAFVIVVMLLALFTPIADPAIWPWTTRSRVCARRRSPRRISITIISKRGDRALWQARAAETFAAEIGKMQRFACVRNMHSSPSLAGAGRRRHAALVKT